MSGLQSLREQMGVSYRKPEVSQMDRYIDELGKNDEASAYLASRGFSEKTISHFKLGYNPELHAISIPIFKKKELINIRYRLLGDGKSKYSQEKNCEVWVYNEEGFEQARQQGWLLIVEGEFDLMSCWQAGFKNVISPASGKDSYMKWIEKVDSIPKVSIAYDNDKPGKDSALKLAERIGVEKCKEVIYPNDYNDANEYFTKHVSEDPKKDFLQTIKESSYFYKYTYTGVGDIMKEMFEKPSHGLQLDTIPFIEPKPGQIIIVSGDTNVGKTNYALNIVKELADKNIPTLVLPFEDGISEVGRRYIQIVFDKTQDDFLNVNLGEGEKENMISKLVDQEVYFALPEDNDMVDIIRKAKRIFGIQVVVVDHLDYMVQGGGGGDNYVQKVGQTLNDYNLLGQTEGIIFIVVHQMRKENQGASKTKRPRKEDLKGASSIAQVARGIVMLYKDNPSSDIIEAIAVKNKGKHGYKKFNFRQETGVMKSLGGEMEGNPEDEEFDNSYKL